MIRGGDFRLIPTITNTKETMSTPLLVLLAVSASSLAVPMSPVVHDTECLGGVEATFLSEPVDDDVKRTIDEGERAFSVHLIKSVFGDLNATGIHENIFLSPASVFQTLMLAYMGAAGETERELAETMGFAGNVSRSDVMKNYLFERAFQVRNNF